MDWQLDDQNLEYLTQFAVIIKPAAPLTAAQEKVRPEGTPRRCRGAGSDRFEMFPVPSISLPSSSFVIPTILAFGEADINNTHQSRQHGR